MEIGWREHVALPDLGISSLRAKIDTGARTSALHAIDLETFDRGGFTWAKFIVPIEGKKHGLHCEVQTVDQRKIRNTGGGEEDRHVIQTTIVLGRRHWLIEVSLTNREHMEFDLIVGRTAIRRHRLLVNPGRSYLAGLPARARTAAHSLN
jgi:hypothetical protein